MFPNELLSPPQIRFCLIFFVLSFFSSIQLSQIELVDLKLNPFFVHLVIFVVKRDALLLPGLFLGSSLHTPSPPFKPLLTVPKLSLSMIKSFTITNA